MSEMQRLPIRAPRALALSLSLIGLALVGLPAAASTETTPSVDLKINGSSSPVVASCGVTGLTFDGSATVGEERYLVSIQKSDRWFNGVGDEVAEWFTGEVPADFDLVGFATEGGLELEGDSYYRVKLAIGEPAQEVVRLLHLLPATVEMWVNGRPNPELDLTLGPLTMDGQYSFCELAYFVAMQRSNKEKNRQGAQHQQWFDGEVPDAFDLGAFWEGKAGEPLKSGCYWIKLAVAGPWAQAEKHVCMQ